MHCFPTSYNVVCMQNVGIVCVCVYEKALCVKTATSVSIVCEQAPRRVLMLIMLENVPQIVKFLDFCNLMKSC